MACALSYATGIIETSLSKARMMTMSESTAQFVTKMMMERVRTKTIDAATRYTTYDLMREKIRRLSSTAP